MQYATRYITECSFFRAEQVFTELSRRHPKDLLTIEDDLAGYSDCIIMVLESVGTFAELGAFALSDKVAQIVLAINDVAFRHAKSFINDGPLRKISEQSKFGATLYCDLAHGGILNCTSEIQDRLAQLSRRRDHIDLSSIEKFRGTTGKTRMLFLCDLIAVFSPVSERNLRNVLAQIYGERPPSITLDVALLKALGLVQSSGVLCVRSLKDRGLFFDFPGLDVAAVRALVFNHYHRYHKDKLAALHTSTVGR